MRLLVPLAAILLVGFARNLPHHHKAHKRHVDHRAAAADEDAIRALQDEELRAWEDDQRVRRQLASSDMAAEEKMRLAEEHWNKFSPERRRGGCKGRYRPAPPGQIRRRCPPRTRTPHDRVAKGDSSYIQQYPDSGYTYNNERSYDAAAYEADRLEHEARLRRFEEERAQLERDDESLQAERAAYEEKYRAAERRRAEEEERYRLALEERLREEEESARNRAEDERRYNELNEQRLREYDELLRRHREQNDNHESARRRAPCPALRHDIFDGKTYEQIFLYAHKSGCSEEETRTAIDMARRQRIEQYALKYVYPVLFYSRTRGWIKIHNERERLAFEEQEADLDFKRLLNDYQFVKKNEESRAHPHHPPAYTDEELERSRKLTEKENENFAVIDKDNNEAVAYGNEEGEKETVIDAIVLPQDVTDEETVEEEPKPAPTKEELEDEKNEIEEVVKEEEQKEIVDAVLDELKEKTEEQAELKEKLAKDQAEKDRLAAELEEEKRKNELLEKELAEKKEEEEKARMAQEEAELAKAEAEETKPVEKELPDEEETVAEEEKKEEEQPKEDPMEVKVEEPVPVDSNIGDEIEPLPAVEEVKEEEKVEENKEEEEKKAEESAKTEEAPAPILKADGKFIQSMLKYNILRLSRV
ncbi:hypothetical protein PRIPAC_86549 [Pristionchus pacificus]|uniref:Uncharacterized protein n=1 Tax=Pristionchus pacificus TaxID=54126 RepID=A0A2A6CCN8_PRIPA|nr:hypothetical protein PRIPAC_86549 [Pristionchus pacificus]|eukprot:PDM75860.1 hypothetical protein PRIPAC_40239 [Pristionchus pacificus]